MYKARHQTSGEDIIILDPRWLAQLKYLRQLDRHDALVCPGCEQPVRVRAGKIKRWHFAHKHLLNCPFEQESPRLLQTRAAVYDWLVGKFGRHAISIEKELDIPTPRHIDCWVKTGSRTFAYWIFDRLMPPSERQLLKSARDENELEFQFLFIVDLLRRDKFTSKSRLHLTTTEREFLYRSELDKAYQTHFDQLGGSLRYLDPDREILITYRSLNLIHSPQLYAGKRLQNPLSDVLVSTSTGEFIHPGELEQLQQRQKEIETQQRQIEERLRQAKEFFKGASLSQWSSSQEKAPNTKTLVREGTCQICGAITTDWVTYYGQTKTCVCRSCSGKR